MEDIKIERYNPGFKEVWNDFVESSKNGTFLFNREYMDYHSHRFQDNSFLIYRKGKLYCLLPANRKKDVLYSHQGLTYGGLIMNDACTSVGILEVFDILIQELNNTGIKKLIYKPVPYIYHRYPSQEDLYALFRHNAKLVVRNISSAIFQPASIKFSTLRNRMVKKGKSLGMEVHESNDLKEYWEILTNNLSERYKTKPVHSLEEIESLHNKFPNQIKLYTAIKGEEMLGGVVCYIEKKVVHIQYISASKEGKESGALDCIFYELINKYNSIPYFDFGISNEDGGRYLNENLIHQKEGFGARGVCYDTWELEIGN